jgi:hypothetical protein
MVRFVIGLWLPKLSSVTVLWLHCCQQPSQPEAKLTGCRPMLPGGRRWPEASLLFTRRPEMNCLPGQSQAGWCMVGIGLTALSGRLLRPVPPHPWSTFLGCSLEAQGRWQ